MPIEPHDLQEQLVALLKQELGPKLELVEYEVANQQHDYLVLLARLRHPSLQIVVKLAGPEAPAAYSFDRTAALHRLAASHTTIPMPDVIAVDVSCRRWPWRYLIKTRSPGQEWALARHQMEAAQLSDAYRQIGDAVAQLHSIRFPAFGELDVNGRVQTRHSFTTALRERASRFINSARLCDFFLAAFDQNAELFEDVCDARLCHEDLHGHNILFENQQGQWRLSTILDFDKAWAGHCKTDLARLDLWTGMTSAAFWRAYEAICPIEPLYEQRRSVYQLLWCLECAQPTTKHLADTRRVCKVLGIPPIEHF